MKDRNITNMITSIISVVMTIVFIPLIIVRYVNVSKLGVIFLSIGYSVLLVYFILKSIYFGIENEKAKCILYRIFRVLIDVFFCLILSYFCLSSSICIKWVLFGLVCFFTIFNMICSAFNSLNVVRWILQGILIESFLYLILDFKSNIVILIGCTSVLLFYIANIAGNATNNKLLLSSDIVSTILFGLFLLFI